MIPILYDKYETAFTSNGMGRLADCISCTVTEERNGIYECQFTYPVTGEMFPEIQEGRIIAVIHDDAKDIQPFDIYAHSAPLNGVVTFYAHHVSYRLGSVILKPMEASSCVAALTAIPNNTYNPCQFTFWTDKATSGRWENKVPSAVKAILGGQRGSILDVYGKGEYKWDKFLVRLYVNRGNDNGVSIRYGVNLTDLKQDYDESGSYNAVAPYWVNSEDGTVVTLTKGIVAVNATTRLVPWTTQSGEEITDRAGNTIYFEVGVPFTPVPMDLSEAFDEQPTEAQLETEALRRLNSSEAWLPSENITVKFINLADTEEYKNVSALQRVSLCDRVSVYCGPLNVSAVKMQVIRVVYNVLTERYNEMELGKAKVSFAQTIEAKVEEATKDLPTASMMQKAINNATDKITGAMGGHVRFIYDTNGKMQEILIMDTDDINTAVKVWRWNSGGFGFSSNGYDGPYALAMTMDGAIVADFITAGTMSANRISGGVIDGETILAKLLNIVNNNGDIIASFADTIVLGLNNYFKFRVLYNSISFIKNDGTPTFQYGDLRDESGVATLEYTFVGNGSNTRFEVQHHISSILIVKVNNTVLPENEYSFGTPSDYYINLKNAPADGANIYVKFTSNYECMYFTVGLRKANSVIGNNSVSIGNYNIASGADSYAIGTIVEASGESSHAEGYTTKAIGDYSHVEGRNNTASGNYSHAEGGTYIINRGTTASGESSHAEGYYTTASGEGSHAEGGSTTASGEGSHAEGGSTTASGTCSHAEGNVTIASGYSSHVEGRNNTASGNYSHAEGYYTTASGESSHAEGNGTTADYDNQHVYGKYNISGDNAEIVGNGVSWNRSNARTLDWSGNEWIAGTLTQASDSRLKEESGEVPDLSNIRARRFKWNDKKGTHDDLDHIGYFAQDVEKVAPYIVQEDAMGYKSLDYIALLCAKVEYLERRVKQLESEVKRNDD